MATFPAITPDERRYSIGWIPTAEYIGPSGVAYLYRIGTLAVGQTLELPYDTRPTAEISAIVAHFEGQNGDAFELPAAVWCGHEGGDAIADASLRWIYTSRPEPEFVSAGFYSLSVTLEAVGLTIGPTVSGPVTSSGVAELITGAPLPTLPPRPQPIPDPDILPPVITETESTDGQLPAGTVETVGLADLRHSSFALPDTGEVITEGTADLRHSSFALPDTGEVVIEGTAELTYTPPP
jgi:hypothetical protein